MIVVTDHSDYNHTENFIQGDTPSAERVKNQKYDPRQWADIADPDFIVLCSRRNYQVLWSGSSNATIIVLSRFLQLARFSGYTRIRCPAV